MAPCYSASHSSTAAAPAAAPAAAAAQGPLQLPAAPLFVQNTFLTSEDARPTSMDDFYTARRIHSCPVSPAAAPLPEDELPEPLPRQPSRLTPYFPGEQLVQRIRAAFSRDTQRSTAEPSATAHGEATGRGAGGTDARGAVPRGKDGRASPESEECSTATPSSPRSEGEPVLGSSELPSLGSAGHKEGRCKPCVFVSKRGCRSGEACDFCHLCAPGEKKRRQRERRAFFSAMRRMNLEEQGVAEVGEAAGPPAPRAADSQVVTAPITAEQA